jgi:hypothetical protein
VLTMPCVLSRLPTTLVKALEHAERIVRCTWGNYMRKVAGVSDATVVIIVYVTLSHQTVADPATAIDFAALSVLGQLSHRPVANLQGPQVGYVMVKIERFGVRSEQRWHL